MVSKQVTWQLGIYTPGIEMVGWPHNFMSPCPPVSCPPSCASPLCSAHLSAWLGFLAVVVVAGGLFVIIGNIVLMCHS